MECPYVPVTSYGEFSERLHQKTGGRRIPVTGSIEVTARCNLRCAHCFINLPAGDIEAQRRELTSTQFMSIIDQITEEGCLWLLLTGGEPFLRPDFLDIYLHAKRRGLMITIFTNGTAITPGTADVLAEWRPFAVEISLYGATRQTYERITGVTGSYDRCMRGIELLLHRDIPVKLKTMVMTLNRHELQDINAYADGLGVAFRFDPILNLRRDGTTAPATLRLRPEEVVELDLNDPKRLKSWHDFCDRFSGPPPRPDYLYQCGAALSTFHIDPYGQLSPCLMARKPAFDLPRGTFHEGWHQFLASARQQKWTKHTPCRHCELIALCGQCPGWAQVEHGDQEAPVDYLCAIAHARAEAFGLTREEPKKRYGRSRQG
jgi:radical SAM protein with 4Fe4S-binding SPASM domain